MVMDLESLVYKRDQETYKSTLMSKNGKRHLREYINDIDNNTLYEYPRIQNPSEPFSHTIIKSLGYTKYKRVREVRLIVK